MGEFKDLDRRLRQHDWHDGFVEGYYFAKQHDLVLRNNYIEHGKLKKKWRVKKFYKILSERLVNIYYHKIN